MWKGRGVKQTLAHVEKQNLPAQMHAYVVKQKIVRIVKQNFMMVVVMKKKMTNFLFLLFCFYYTSSTCYYYNYSAYILIE